MSSIKEFPLVDKYIAQSLGFSHCRLPEKDIFIVESERRSNLEKSYGYLRSLWLQYLNDGRVVVSVPKGLAGKVSKIISQYNIKSMYDEGEEINHFKSKFDTILNESYGYQTDKIFYDINLACNKDTIKLNQIKTEGFEIKRIVNKGCKYADDIWPPEQCIPSGILYGVFKEDLVVSVGYAHKTGLMEKSVVDLAVVTSKPFRNQGLGKAIVYETTNHMIKLGGEAFYNHSLSNTASGKIASAVGFVPVGRSAIFMSKSDK